ncbi:MAG: outer membrane protein assembly factor BamA [Pseudomonadota bacterium]
MRTVQSGGDFNKAFAMAALAFIAALFQAFAGAAHAQPAAGAQDPQAQGASPAAGLFAPKGPPPLIQSIAVSGNQRIEASTIGSYLVVAPGDYADEQLLDLGVKTLFNTGLFSDVSLSMQEGGVLLIDVKENPIVNQVILDGNKRVKEDKITEEIQLAPRSIFTKAKAQSDSQRIIEVYRRTGRFAATVTPKVKQLEQNRIDVIYEIDEGPKTGVAKINFVGNEVFTDRQLREVLLTKESRWWRFFSSNANYDPDRLEFERELLRQHYGRNGYADFQVVNAVAELTPDRKDFFITFTIDEGEKYTINDVKVKTTLAKLDEGVLERFVPIRSGQTFDGEKVEKAVESITFATGATGYAFVDVNPRIQRNTENKTIDLVFEVNEGPRVYVERINIKGNTQTLDKVIRREIRIAEGDPFNRVLVDRSRARIRSLGYFGEVNIEEKPGSAPDRTELDVSVEEQSTGSFSVGVGVSSTENFIADFSIQQSNLLGRGQFLRLRVQASSRTRSVDIRFTQPYFLDRNLAAGFSLFNTRTNFRESGFIRDRIGFGLNAGFQISEFGRGNLQYLFTRDDVDLDEDNVFNTVQFLVPTDGAPEDLLAPGVSLDQVTFDPDANTVTGFRCNFSSLSFDPLCAQRGEFITSLLGYSVSFDRRDDPIDPTRGWRASLSQSVAGLGGNVNYWRTQFNGAYYKKLLFGLVGVAKLNAGYIDGFAGDDVRLSDRFFQGAGTFRGFEVAGVGPRFLTGGNGGPGRTRDGNLVGQAIGGKISAIASGEIILPLPLPKEYGIRAALFADVGTVGLVDDNTKALNDNLSLFVNPDSGLLCTVDPSANCIAPVQDDLSVRLSAGVSIAWDSPFGPVRFDIAEVFRKEDFDEVESFRFSAGTSF